MNEFPRFVVELNEAQAAEGLVKIPLLKLGTFAKRQDGKVIKFSVTRETMAAVIRNFRKRGGAEVVIDYDHGSANPDGDLTPAAGWLKAIDDGPDANGVLYGTAEFTEKARKAIAAKELRYISPELNYTALDKTTGEPQGPTIPAVAATNRPFLDGLPAIALSDRAWTEIDRGDAEDDAARKGKHTVKVILTDRVARTVRVVADDGTESVLQVEGLEAAPRQVVKLSDLTAGGDGRYDFATVTCGDGVLIESGVFRAQLAQNALDAAIAAGKILPAQRKFYATLALNDLAGFEAFVKDAPKVVNLSEVGTGADTLQLNDLAQVDLEIDRLTKLKMSQSKMDYAGAVKLVLSENPKLAERKKRLVTP